MNAVIEFRGRFVKHSMSVARLQIIPRLEVIQAHFLERSRGQRGSVVQEKYGENHRQR